ncbi:hypothetical protein OROHE_000342 [Orobanche hederae]
MATAQEMVVLTLNPGAGGNPNRAYRNLMMRHSIFIVPAYIRDRNPDAYTPKVVSIGPYHHVRLQNMEEHKKRALQHLARRSNKSDQDFIDVIKIELKKSIMQLKDSYQQLGPPWRDDEDEFLELMIYDGAFLYEFMRCFFETETSDYDTDDPVFSYFGLLNFYPFIIPDIIMIENQLPLHVLERLIAVETRQLNQRHDQKVSDLVFKLLGQAVAPQNEGSPRLHVLDLARQAIAREDLNGSTEPNRNPATQVHSASALSDAGLQFSESVLQGTSGIEFSGGTLYVAPLCIDTFTAPLFLNSIVFERVRPGAGRQVSSYVAFIAGLIRTSKDVSLLTSHQLVDCRISGGDELVANLMTTISENVFFDPYSSLCQVRDSLNTYYLAKTKSWKRRLREWGRNFSQNYFANPWTIISLFAAVVLLVLTMLQTVYTMLGYYKGTDNNIASSPT